MINFSHVNYLAVAVATMTSFVFLSIWYSRHHAIGKKWLELSGANPLKHLIYIAPISFLATFAMCTLFAGFVDGSASFKDSPLKDALLKSVIISCGFIIPLLTIQNLFYFFGGRKWQLILIDSVFYIVQFAIFAVILTWMRQIK